MMTAIRQLLHIALLLLAVAGFLMAVFAVLCLASPAVFSQFQLQDISLGREPLLKLFFTGCLLVSACHLMARWIAPTRRPFLPKES